MPTYTLFVALFTALASRPAVAARSATPVLSLGRTSSARGNLGILARQNTLCPDQAILCADE
jgi:hypothetical protein